MGPSLVESAEHVLRSLESIRILIRCRLTQKPQTAPSAQNQPRSPGPISGDLSIMFSLKPRLIPILCIVGLCAVAAATVPVFGLSPLGSAVAQEADAGDAASPVATASAERGRYLANDVAMCVQCHSPRNSRRGDLVGDRLFTGAAIPLKSPYKGTPRWAFTAPNLRNAPGYTEAEFVDFLMSGMRPNGTEARSPMPAFRMNRSDAQAVYDYLMSF